VRRLRPANLLSAARTAYDYDITSVTAPTQAIVSCQARRPPIGQGEPSELLPGGTRVAVAKPADHAFPVQHSGYNAQTVVAEHQIVIAAEIRTNPADFSNLRPMIDTTLTNSTKPA
jgi:hypothetical protein